MTTYRVRVTRKTYEDITITVNASDLYEARHQAMIEAVNITEGWEGLDCDYQADVDDIVTESPTS